MPAPNPKAIADYDQAINLDSEDALAYYNRGNAWRNLKEYQKAIADYNQAINLDSEFAEPYFGRGLTYYEQGDKERGIKDMKKAEQLFCQQDSSKCEPVRDILKQIGG